MSRHSPLPCQRCSSVCTKLSPSEVMTRLTRPNYLGLLITWSALKTLRWSADPNFSLASPLWAHPWWPIVGWWGHFSGGHQRLSSWAISVKIEPANHQPSIILLKQTSFQEPRVSQGERPLKLKVLIQMAVKLAPLENFEQMSHSWATPTILVYGLCFSSVASDESDSILFSGSFQHEGRTPWIILC